MASFAIRYPFFVLMACLMVIVVGTVAVVNMPVDLFQHSRGCRGDVLCRHAATTD
jgi:hypothetical protein